MPSDLDPQMPVRPIPATPHLDALLAFKLTRNGSTVDGADRFVANLAPGDKYARIAQHVRRIAQPLTGAVGGTVHLELHFGAYEMVELADLIEYLAGRADDLANQALWAAEVVVAQMEGVKIPKSRRRSFNKVVTELLDVVDGHYPSPLRRRMEPYTVASVRARFEKGLLHNEDQR